MNYHVISQCEKCYSKVWNLRYDESMPLKMYGVYSLLLSRSTREPNYIYIAHLQAERIGASSMRIARKTAKLFTCLGSSTQLGQSIIGTSLRLNISHELVNKYNLTSKNMKTIS